MADSNLQRPGAAVLVGGSGFVGASTASELAARGWQVTIVDRTEPPRRALAPGVDWVRCDLLVDRVDLSPGDVVLLLGNGDPRTRWQWHQPLQAVATTARVLPALQGRRVTLCSTLEVFGTSPAPLTENSTPVLPWDDDRLRDWLDRGPTGDAPCPPWTVAAWCRELVEADPSGRWVYGMSKRAQELLVERADTAASVVLRLANTVGPGQERVVARLARRASTGRTLQVTHPVRRSFLPVQQVARIIDGGPPSGTYVVGSPSIELSELADRLVAELGPGTPVQLMPVAAQDSCGQVDRSALDPLGLGTPSVDTWLDEAVKELLTADGIAVHPPIGVVVPPQPALPDVIVARQQTVLWSGAVKHGNRWSTELEQRLHERLGLTDAHRLLATTSGTDALRIMCGSLVGPAGPGRVAALPSFTFPATGEVLAQLGYRLRFVDVDPVHWTMDPDSLREALAPGDVDLVVAVDTFGNPVDYEALGAVCGEAGVPLLADSAAALGSELQGRPIGSQAVAHAFSMSFAKVLSAGGAGGAVVVPADSQVEGPFGWTRSALMNELHAVVALDQLDVLDQMVERRTRNAELYDDAVERLGLERQHARDDSLHCWVHYAVRLPGGEAQRDRVAARLAELGVGTKAYFLPLHTTGADMASVRSAGPELTVTEQLGRECLALPMSSELNDEAIDRICVALDWVLGEG